jgi:hypothetical protein
MKAQEQKKIIAFIKNTILICAVKILYKNIPTTGWVRARIRLPEFPTVVKE